MEVRHGYFEFYTASRAFAYLCLPDPGTVHILSLLVPLPQTASAHGKQIVIDGMPSVKQWYNLSCEYAAAAAVTLFWGGELVGQESLHKRSAKQPQPAPGLQR